MNTKKIKEADISPLRIASLPSRPTAPTSLGGKGFTATEMKEAFDKLPLYIIGRLNSLIDDIEGVGEGSAAASIQTGIKEGHSLAALFSDIVSGEVGNYLSVLGEPLNECIMALKEAAESHPEDIGALRSALAELTGSLTALEGKLTEAKGALGEAAEEIDTLAADIAAAAADILLLDTDVESAKAEISKATEGIERTAEELSEARADIAALDAKQTADGERIAFLDAKQTADDERIAALDAKQTADGERIAALDAKQAADDERIAALDAKLAADGERIAALDAKQTADGERIAALDAKQTADGERIAALDAKLDSLGESGGGGGGGGGSIFYPETEWEHDVTLACGMEARVGYADGVAIRFPDELPDDYYATLSFYAGDIEPYFMLMGGPRVYFSGAHTEDGEFYPSFNQHYTLFFWFDRVMHCNVRAVLYYE